MIKFKKVFNFKIVSLIVFVVFLSTGGTYAIDSPDKSHLRPPPQVDTEEGIKRLREVLSEVTYHDRVNSYIEPRARAQYDAFLKGEGLEDNEGNLGLFYDSLEKYNGIAVMDIDGLYENTRILEHIGLGRVYGKPIIYVDSSLEGEDRGGILQHANGRNSEINGWTKERDSLGLDESEWYLMRRYILEDYQRFETARKRIHAQAHNIDHILEKYRATHLLSETKGLLYVIASMPFKEGNVMIAAGGGGSGQRNEAPEWLKQEYIDAAGEKRLVVGKYFIELQQIPRDISQEEWDRRVYEMQQKYDIAAIESKYNRLSNQIAQYDPPEGFDTYFRWMKDLLGIQSKSRGSPLELLSFMVQNGHYKDKPISREDLKRARGFEDTTIYYETASLERVGLLQSIPDSMDHRKRLYFLTKRLTPEQVEAIGEAVPELGKKTITDLPDKEIAKLSQRVDNQLRAAIGSSLRIPSADKTRQGQLSYVEFEYTTLMAADGIKNPEAFEKAIDKLLDSQTGVKVIAREPYIDDKGDMIDEIEQLKDKIGEDTFNRLHKRGVEFRELDEMAMAFVIHSRNNAKDSELSNVFSIEGIIVFGINEEIKNHKAVDDVIKSGV